MERFFVCLLEGIRQLADILWGVPAMVLLLAVGIAATAVTRWVQLRRLPDSFRLVAGSLRETHGGVSPFQAVCTALAATVGTGNIAGVAGAIALGGPGAVFWMWVSAFFGMATKYAEVVLAMRYRRRDEKGQWQGGPMYYIRDGMGCPRLAALFALFALLASFGMGNMAQVNTIATAAQEAAAAYFPALSPQAAAWGTGLLCAAAVIFLTGAKRVGRVMERLVPVVAALYILAAGAVIVLHGNELGSVLRSIVLGAFSPAAVLGGGVGIGIRQAVRFGVSRGVFSNEAGLGSAPMAHAAAEARPKEQGLLGIFEVFLDTIVLCTLTALAILVSGVPIPYGGAAGAELACAALETVFGALAPGLLTLCIALLALGTLLCWQLYGLTCARYLWGNRGTAVYRAAFAGAALLGAAMDLSAVWIIADALNGLMLLPNLAALFYLLPQVSPTALTDVPKASIL